MNDLVRKDPVCGMVVPAEDAAAQSEFDGTVYNFCSEECREKFDNDPGLYIESKGLQNVNADSE